MKITKGKWWFDEDFINKAMAKHEGKTIAQTLGVTWEESEFKHYSVYSELPDDSPAQGNFVAYCGCHKETEANAELIVEAGTVHNETGMMPRELVKQRDKLAWLLKQIIADLPTNKDWLNPDIEADARALIERIK